MRQSIPRDVGNSGEGWKHARHVHVAWAGVFCTAPDGTRVHAQMHTASGSMRIARPHTHALRPMYKPTQQGVRPYLPSRGDGLGGAHVQRDGDDPMQGDAVCRES